MLKTQINFNTPPPIVLKFSEQRCTMLLKLLRCAHISRIALIVSILSLLLEQVLFLHLEISQGEGHNRW
jgi:hypothetical protein